MTIEIRQLVIRALADAQAPARAPAEPTPRHPPPAASTASERDALIAACVREVLRELRRASER